MEKQEWESAAMLCLLKPTQLAYKKKTTHYLYTFQVLCLFYLLMKKAVKYNPSHNNSLTTSKF